MIKAETYNYRIQQRQNMLTNSVCHEKRPKTQINYNEKVNHLHKIILCNNDIQTEKWLNLQVGQGRNMLTVKTASK